MIKHLPISIQQSLTVESEIIYGKVTLHASLVLIVQTHHFEAMFLQLH